MPRQEIEGRVWVPASELARERGVSRVVVYNNVTSGTLEGKHFGRTLMIPVEAADAWQPKQRGWQKGRPRKAQEGNEGEE